MSEESTREREINGLIEASNATDCNNILIITADHQEEITTHDEKKIHVIPAWRWLLNK